ncbi:E3 ubiquitin-protein ligase TRIM39-like [Eleginops maclovinus]|uniref:E3 ubiquitin-protein ligase TRIM39-like n=1 Tax=Eleginops maclovinus TaxID=56733 RepID=UPI003080D702
MASNLEKDLSCPICHDIFDDPIVLTCCHSFCKGCLQNWWGGNPLQQCPVCKRRSSRSEPPRNLALKNLCETFILERDQESSENLCSLHFEKLQLFCLDDQRPVCLVCRDSKTHAAHRFRPIDEAAQDLKEELQKSLKPLQEKLKRFEQAQVKFDQTAGHMKVQARRTETQIKEQFKKLHRFLEEEEEARMSTLREEEEQKRMMMKNKMEAVSKEIAALSHTVSATEEELRAEDVSFLHNYKAAVERLQRPLLEDPQLPSGALIDEAKHLGNLAFTIWSKMKYLVSYHPVVLDSNTAHPELIVSEDLTSLRREERQELPENPERIYSFLAVLGSEGFTSGTHSWDVKVRDSPVWAVGVAESVKSNVDKLDGFFRVVNCDGEYVAESDREYSTVLRVKNKIKRITIFLDLNRGNLSFSDSDTDTHIHTFKHTFTKQLFPYFNTVNAQPLKILPIPFYVVM